MLSCGTNQFTTLDISHNTGSVTNPGGLNSLHINDMPSLYKVCVWSLPFPPSGLTVDSSGSPNVYYSIDCSK